ncbi:hypothetical protein CVT26_008593 [Gymnopilus dilepis]|uniref:D-xylose 1-dehydrogenase (NADP(+), D-xylono-1,5-lactone-forming) n=1 Tax=Gymnopilus dilepis TaxID=231916 RepID=A0A409XXW1_9AGAR|nr:hypothetical protein CVT26_008593 [Gymnopilus dilepis]
MALLLQYYTFFKQYVDSYLHPVPGKSEGALKVGVLGTGMIDPAGIVYPAATHPEVILYAIGSRDASEAASYASKYGFQKSYGSYEEVLADPEVDFMYIPLPNGLHFEWAYKSLEAGKHVLLEKPSTSNAREAEALVKKAEETGKVLLEAFHWQFHPAAHRFREILDSGKYGGIISTYAEMTATPALPPDNIRWQYDLAGGSLMDMTYVVSFTRFALKASTPDDVLYAKATPHERDDRVDRAMEARLRFKRPNMDPRSDNSDVYSTIHTDMARSWAYHLIPRVWEFPSIRVETEFAEIFFYNAMFPHIYHYIAVTDKRTGQTHYEKAYKGGPLWKDRGEAYWSTYRYQLEAFVDKVKGRQSVWWIDGENSVAQMKTIDAIYEKSGLPLRPTSKMLD